MSQLLQIKRALITGGSRGTDAGIAMRLAREGADVALTYVSKPLEADKTKDLNSAAGAFADAMKKLLALSRYGHVDEVAAMVAYLAGPEAGFVTGASLTMDGGFTASPQ